MNEEVLTILEKVTGTPEVRRNLDIELFDEGLVDSLGFVELIVELSAKFSIPLAPAEVERAAWSTPRKIITYLEGRTGASA